MSSFKPEWNRISVQILTGISTYEVIWKVRNFGQQAEEIGQLRGELSLDGGQNRRQERTSYVGRHYVEAYIIKDGHVLAKHRHPVVVGPA